MMATLHGQNSIVQFGGQTLENVRLLEYPILKFGMEEKRELLDLRKIDKEVEVMCRYDPSLMPIVEIAKAVPVVWVNGWRIPARRWKFDWKNGTYEFVLTRRQMKRYEYHQKFKERHQKGVRKQKQNVR